jgi:predicted glutamine amidotransferase
MCQLLAMSCNSAAAISFSFTGFAERGGRTDHHADGWGIGFYEACGCRTFHDSAPACSSALAGFVKTYPIKSRIVLAHIRKATQGATGLSNCHPFSTGMARPAMVVCPQRRFARMARTAFRRGVARGHDR